MTSSSLPKTTRGAERGGIVGGRTINYDKRKASQKLLMHCHP